MHAAGEVFWSLESALDKRIVDDHFGGDVRQFTSLPSFHLLSHRLKVSFHAVNTNRDAVNERERLRVFREHGRKHAWDNASELAWSRTIRVPVIHPTHLPQVDRGRPQQEKKFHA